MENIKICSSCNVPKALNCFSYRKSGKHQILRAQCRQCIKLIINKRFSSKIIDLEKIKICNICNLPKKQKDFFLDKETTSGVEGCCKECKIQKRRNRLKNPDIRRAKRESNKKTYKKVKDLVFSHYGGYICNCCGETLEKLLTIDHIDNNGNNHRKEIKQLNIYTWLKINNYPPGFQVLCWNCNMGKYQNGGICPHKEVMNVS